MYDGGGASSINVCINATIILPRLSGEKNAMQKAILFISVLFLSFISCKKDKGNFTTGIVQLKGGCFSDSWLVAIDNPDLQKHSFLCPADFTTSTLYDCSNAVFMHLPSPLAITGTRIRFSWTSTVASCLSYSRAPNHITVKNLSGL